MSEIEITAHAAPARPHRHGGLASPPALFLVALIAQVILHAALPLARVIEWPWNVLGLIPVATGFALAIIGDEQFKRAGTPIRPHTPPTVLVTNGVFRVSRNPMYLGIVTILIGIATLLGSLTPFALAPIYGTTVSIGFIRHEERMVAALFGDAYRDYTRRVRRWI